MNPARHSMQSALEDAAELFRRTRRVVVLTGAGISTPSGIPDFRSEGTGLWSRDEPLEAASLNSFRRSPETFFAWFRPLADRIFDAQPNAAHRALAEFEQAGHAIIIATQNIDGLHHKAGSTKVIELHGTIRTLSCTQCFRQYESSPFLKPFIEAGTIPLCANCNGILKPDVILFGEQLPQAAWFEAQRETRQADLMIVAGSSLEVLPVAGLPMQAVDRGAHLIVINNTPTYINVRADVVIMGDVAAVIPDILHRVIHG
jgi:NAD-dependent deacetylase